MRTTVTLDDDLLRAYKARAATKGTTLSQEIEGDLRFALQRASETKRKPFRLVTVGGESLAGIDTSNNASMFDALDAE